MKGELRSPIRWYGGKGNFVSKLLNLLPPTRYYEIYVEVFGGGAQLLFAKKTWGLEVYNDIDSGLVNFFRVLRDEEKFEKFYKKVYLTPYSREEYYYCRDTWEDCEDDVERAYRWFIAVRMSFSGELKSGWSYSINKRGKDGMAESVSRYLSTIELLPQLRKRIMRVQIEHDDFRKIIPRYDTKETLFYMDPPYVLDTRVGGEIYQYEMSNKDHEDLVEILLNIKGLAMLSGYKNKIYEKLEKNGWIRYDYETACHAVGRTRETGILGKGSARLKQPRVESVWLNYDPGKLNGIQRLF